MSKADEDTMSEIEKSLMPEMEDDAAGEAEPGVRAMLNVPLRVDIVIGRTRQPLASLISMKKGAVLELDRRLGDDVEVVLHEHVVARGQLVKVGDNGIGVKLTSIVREITPAQG